MHYSFCIEHNNPVEKVDEATAAEFSMLNFEFELGPHEFMCSYIQEPSSKLSKKMNSKVSVCFINQQSI